MSEHARSVWIFGVSGAAAQPLQSPPIPVALIGDLRLVGDGIAALLNQFDDLKVVYGHASDAITPLKRLRPQVVLLDIGARRGDSLRVAARVHREFPEVIDLIAAGLSNKEIAARHGWRLTRPAPTVGPPSPSGGTKEFQARNPGGKS